MLFSEAFRITPSEEDDWFDPILFTDTRLFIDPFLIFDDEAGHFEGSHAELVSFFEHIFLLLAKGRGRTKSRPVVEAHSLLELGEVRELCLGYTDAGTHGSGSGRGMARQMAAGITEAIEQGVVKLDHFEEVQIFEEGIGPDRISDATAGILRHRLAKYTSDVAKRHELPTRLARYGRARFDPERGRWKSGSFELPKNPYTGGPVLLVPRKFLRALPTINPDDFWEFCFDNAAQELARDFGEEISRRVDKETIVEFAKRHPDLRKRYVKSKEVEGGEPYDTKADPSGYYQPYIGARGWVSQNPLQLRIRNSDDLLKAVKQFVARFRTFVEDQDGWRLLWNDDKTPKKEIAFQALFSGIVIPYCEANDIDISKEANIGRGPVDFKFSKGYAKRVLIERN